MALIGKGTTIGHAATQGGPFTTFAQITQEIKPPATTFGEAEVTTFGDTYDQFIPGYGNAGVGSFKLIYTNANTAALYPLVGQMLWWQFTLPDTHTWTVQGFLRKYAPSGPMKTAVVEDLEIRFTGAPVYA